MDERKQPRPGLEASIAHTAAKYDALPYVSKPFTKTHPARIAAIAQIFGLEAPPVATARVLELGSAAGGNIIPHAMRYPEARFLGIDVGRKQVAEGQARVARLGLTNIEIREQSITEIGEADGKFDYIICHGVFSWVPGPVREAIFRIARENLTPNGIAHVSYNVLPGWRMHQPLRDAFRMLIPSQQSEMAQVDMARELLGFMAELAPESGPYGEILRVAPGRLVNEPADYIYHEYLEQTNQPCTFAQFAAMARRHGMEFLAECDLHTMLPENRGTDFAQRLRARVNDDIYSLEQMMDVLTGRSFRETLLVSFERQTQINRQLAMDRLEGLHLRGSRNMKIERNGNAVTLTDAAGRTLQSDEAPVGPAVERLIAAFPASITLDECATHFGDHDRAIIADALFRMVLAGIVTASTDPVAGCMPGKQPRATVLARADAIAGAEITANWAHEAVAIDPIAAVLLPAMDGETDRKALEKLLYDAAVSGRVDISAYGTPPTEPARLRDAIHEILRKALLGIADAGLIDG